MTSWPYRQPPKSSKRSRAASQKISSSSGTTQGAGAGAGVCVCDGAGAGAGAIVRADDASANALRRRRIARASRLENVPFNFMTDKLFELQTPT